MQLNKFFSLAFSFVLFLSISTIHAQEIATIKHTNATPGAGIDWVQDWGTVTYTYSSSFKEVIFPIPGKLPDWKLKIGFVDQSVKVVTYIDKNGYKTELETRDGKTFTLNLNKQRSGGNREVFIEIYNPTSDSAGNAEITINFENFKH
ncbi:MAG: hypothetical protein AAF502_07230 [Bacteroidota bacterium]